MQLNSHFFKAISVFLVSLFLAACGSTPQPTVELASNVIDRQASKIGVYYESPEDQATTHIYGAGCLLCYGVASSLTSSLDDHLESSIDEEELDHIKEIVFKAYTEKSEDVAWVELSSPMDKLPKFKGDLGYAKRDFRILKETLDVDYLVVVDLNAHGAYRSFSNYIPNGDPQGYINGVVFTVDLNTNAYIQYLEINETVQPVGEWDQPKEFPSVTTAYYQAAANVKDTIRKAL